MKNFSLKAAALVAIAATTAMAASPAEARRYHRDHDRIGTAIAAGVVGLAIGAAIASSSNDRYYRDRYQDDYYYDRYPRYRGDYYDRPYPRYHRYDYDRPYRYRGHHCTTRKVYDPYIGRRVKVRYCR